MARRSLCALILCALLLPLAGCWSSADTGASTLKEMEQTEENHQRLVTVDPPPKIERSLERQQLIKRLLRFNTSNKSSYVYLVDYGKVMGHFVCKGKVSSVNSLLTTPMQVIKVWHRGNLHSHVLPSPDLDGSYGSNGDAIFFFTSADVYVEWSGIYMLCDQPLQMATPPELHINVTEKP